MPNTQEVLKESTAVAKRAANLIGKDFEQGVGVITSDTLAQQNDFEFPPEESSTLLSGEQARFEEQTDQFTKSLQTEAGQAKTQTEEALLDYVGSYLDAPGETELTAKSYAREGGVDNLQQELNDINAEIMQEQHSLRRQLEDIDKNLGGGSARGLEIQKEKVRKESLRKQADLAIIQMSIQGKYDSAKTIADRAVAVQMEQQGRQIEAARLLYEFNKDLFDKSDQRAFEAALADRERNFENEKQAEQQRFNLMIEAGREGAPQSLLRQMQDATPEEALAMASPYLGLAERRAAASVLATQALNRRKTLFEMALLGDQSAIDALGYDPSELEDDMTVEDMRNNEEDYRRLGEQINSIDRMMSNTRGFDLSTGAAQLKTGIALRTITPFGQFTIPGAIKDKQDFMNDAKFIIESMTFDRLIELKSKGATFGALSDNELRAIGDSASRLNSSAIRNGSGEIVGFSGNPESVARELQFITDKIKRAQDTLNINMLSKSDMRDAEAVWGVVTE